MKFSIVVPCYNESKNIPVILNRFDAVISRDDIEIILVNNGSTDDSQDVLNDLLEKFTFAKLVNVEKNQGYGFGILSGLPVSQCELPCILGGKITLKRLIFNLFCLARYKT